MKLANLLTVIGIVGAAAVLAVPVVAGPEESETHAVTATCIKVIDGDTIVVKCDKRQMTVDLAGIDAPELGQPWGKEVRSFVRDMVDGNQVTVEVIEAGETGGTARVLVAGQDLSRLLAERGHIDEALGWLAHVPATATPAFIAKMRAYLVSSPIDAFRSAAMQLAPHAMESAS